MCRTALRKLIDRYVAHGTPRKLPFPTGSSGSQATFADAPRVFMLNVRNREAHPAAGGQQRKYSLLKCLPVSGHSRHAARLVARSRDKGGREAARCAPDACQRILRARAPQDACRARQHLCLLTPVQPMLT